VTPIYSLRNIEKSYGKKTALTINRLDLLPGRIYSLTGANGAGKSTLLQLLALLDRPNTGEIRFDGEEVGWRWRDLRRWRKKVTLVHQSPYLFDMTVFQNLILGLRLRGRITRNDRQRVLDTLQAVGLDGFAERRAKELSGGEMQRVALARALSLEPRVLLLDEPTANIDQVSSDYFEKLLLELPQQGMTVILSSHNSSQTQRLADETLNLSKGYLVDQPHLPDSYVKPEPVEESSCLSPLKMQEA
jgi:tungstate transport system ATP-binding protein